ncbi:MAG TPA: hypothetical protein P5513_07865 [Candidatus Diapherotrites archaeon]|nr:hypothetical protein [Candidatus Diapherotrites archaeon]
MKRHIDLYNDENSVTNRFLNLLRPEYHNKTLFELKDIAIKILNDPTTHISEHKKKEYLLNFEKMRSLTQFQFYLTNITMKGSNLSLNQKL